MQRVVLAIRLCITRLIMFTKMLSNYSSPRGADVNAKNMNGMTPLHVAAYGGAREHFELLIAKGADVNAIIKLGHFEGRTPLDFAIAQNSTKNTALLRKHGGKTAEELKAEGK